MDPQQQPQQEPREAVNGSVGNVSYSPTIPRWTPTSDQIRILMGLFYVHGFRSPTPDQILRTTIALRMYGEVECRNVFYWFQNRTARERRNQLFSPIERSNLAPCNRRLEGDDNSPKMETLPLFPMRNEDIPESSSDQMVASSLLLDDSTNRSCPSLELRLNTGYN